MPRELLLLRHGKSSWASPDLEDQHRPLMPRGIQAAQQIAALILNEGLMPSVVRCSTAVRTRETWAVIEETWTKLGVTIPACAYVSTLYLATTHQLAEAIRTVADDQQRLLIIGHNPGLEELFAKLTGKFEAVPTAGLIALRLPIDHWPEFVPQCRGELLGFWRPRELDAH